MRKQIKAQEEEKTFALIMAVLAIMFAIALLFYPSKASAQEITMTSACSVSTKGMEKAERKLVELKCELEMAEVRAKTRKVELEAKAAEVVIAKNAARTVESIEVVDGKTTSYSKTPSAAKHEEKMAGSRSGFWGWFNRPVVPVVLGYNGGYGYGYGPAPGAYQSQQRQPAYGANTTPQQPAARTQTGTAVPRPRR